MTAPAPAPPPADDPLGAALNHAARGLRVIPIAPGAKHPANIGRWQEAATTDPDLIVSWWTGLYRNHGVGVATGATSGVWVLDVDVSDGKAGDETLRDLEATHGPLPDTHEVITGTGGRHLYFAWPPDLEVRNDQSGRLGPGLDVRGEGGQVLAPPTVHPCGTPYEHEASAPLWDFAPAPEWLLELLRPHEAPTPAPTGPRATVLDHDRPGDDWAARTTWADLLGADGWTLHHTDRTGEQHWTRPGKDRREGTSATVGHMGSDVLKVFTSSMRHAGLEPEATYTRLGYLAATRHGGDHTAAARALRAAGYGHQETVAHVAPTITPPAPQAGAVELDASWPTPEPLPTGPPPPPWDPTILPGWIQDQVENISRQIHCAPDLPAMFALGALSTIALGHVMVEARAGHTEHPTLYLVVPAPPSEGKSAALEMAMAPVHDHEERRIEAAADAVAGADTARKIAEKKVRQLEESAATTGDPDKAIEAAQARVELAKLPTPPEGRLTTSDVTPERLATLLAANDERISIVTDESGVLAIDRYGDKRRGSNLDLYLQAWSGRKVTVDRQTAPSVRLRRPLLTIVAGVQPEAWTAALEDPEFRSRGLGARFMATTPAPRGHLRQIDLDRDEWDRDVDETYRARMGALAAELASWSHPATVRLSRDAKRTWTTWGQPLQARMGPTGDLADEASWISKMRDSVIRTSVLLHLADGHPPSAEVDGPTMARACRLGDLWIAHRTRDTTDEAKDARRLLVTLGRLAAASPGELLTVRRIGKAGSKGLRSTKEIAEPLALLEGTGWVRIHANLPAGLRTNPEGLVRAMEGLEVHPTAVDPAFSWDPTPPDAPDGSHDPSPVDHSIGTSVGLSGVPVHTRKNDLSTPSEPSLDLSTGRPPDGPTDVDGESRPQHIGTDRRVGADHLQELAGTLLAPPPPDPDAPPGDT